MTPTQAQDIVTLLKAATGGRTDADTVAYFESSLEQLDYEPALAAATLGVVTWRFFPSWADFRDAYKGQQRAREPHGEQRSSPLPVKPPKHPEWVHVWAWCRNVRSPRCLITFPQQEGDPALTMSLGEYENLRAEWIVAGSPKAEHPIPLAHV